MSRRERRTAFGLLARQAATDAPLAAIVAIVVAVCAFLVSIGPGALAQVSDRELRYTLDELLGSAPRPRRIGMVRLSERQHRPRVHPAGRHRGDHEHCGRRAVSADAAPRIGTGRAAVGGDHDARVRDAARRSETPDRDPHRPDRHAAVAGARDLRGGRGARAVDPYGCRDSPTSHPSNRWRSPSPSPRPSRWRSASATSSIWRPLRSWSPASTSPTTRQTGFWEHRPLLRDAFKGRAEDGRTTYTADVLLDPASTISLPRDVRHRPDRCVVSAADR